MWKDKQNLDPEKFYLTSVLYYVACGGDGYDCFKVLNVPKIEDLEGARTLEDILFGALESLGP